ncbi:hypothetical protein P43SY_002538 [Pythium insidiosum]|uniref:Glycoside hydrolase n=1 Tax=Pythium insidiosum TaxID=114742 RepID=A0AAD5LQZ2_PYTIN|nr:hypothetical protein P43SY_002538 [Pythium insidiosum]
MSQRVALLALLALTLTPYGAAQSVATTNSTHRCFPDQFLFGSATAAYQVEGGWNDTGRTPSIWDDFCRQRAGLECANVADDFLHRYREDIALMVETGLNSFRFSVSWSRAMNWDPDARRMKPNAPGIAFYHAVVDELRRNNIVPIVTLYHWDLPSELHEKLTPQGWLNEDIVTHFVDYADLMFREFGAKVDYWSTFNEPWTFTTQGYGSGNAAPGLKKSRTNAYTVAHNVLLSHGQAVHRFRQLKEEGVIHTNARIGIVLNADFSYPLNATEPLDVAAAERKIQFVLGWFLTPIVSGKYPDIMRERAGDSLPQFTPAEEAVVKGSYDLLMLNHYSSKTVTDCRSPYSKVKCSKQTIGWERDMGVDESRMPPGARPSSTDAHGKRLCTWFTGYPQGYIDTIRWMHKQDPSADILLTENGWCGNETIANEDQLWYYQRYVEQVHLAMAEEKIPIVGYTAWSFVDNYEWGSFKPRFGLYYVNFTSHTGSKTAWTPRPTDLARVPRIAATWYAELAKTKCMPVLPATPAPPPPPPEELPHSTLWSLLSNLLVSSVLAPVVFAAIVAVLVLRRRSALHYTRRANNESTPLLRD